MDRPNSFETDHESDSGSRVNFVKSILRLAPVLASVLAMSACGDKELDKCQLEVAGIQGALEGVGVKHEAPKVDDLQACKIEKSKLDGIMEGWKLMHPEVKREKIELPPDIELNTTILPTVDEDGPKAMPIETPTFVTPPLKPAEDDDMPEDVKKMIEKQAREAGDFMQR
ncbi:MAG: hypothetical protein NTZ25_03125 [Candidatus Peregrinibacteria bacterium]|nr:hypothetical protein [Candidatus Peregrinibacteria bacterium]